MREGAVVTSTLVPDRDLRPDAGADEPAEELAGAVRVGGETFGLESKSRSVRSIMVFVAATSS
jgi:hypothetical protein